MDLSAENSNMDTNSSFSETNESCSLPPSQENTTDFSSFRLPGLNREESNPDLDSSMDDESMEEPEEDPLAVDDATDLPPQPLRIKLGATPRVVVEPLPDSEVFRTPSSETGPIRKRGRGRGRGGSSARGRGRSRVREIGNFQPLDEETCNSFPVTGKDDASSLPEPVGLIDESSQSSTGSASTRKRAKLEVFDPDVDRVVTADQIFEYQWPANERTADYFMLQEQISDYLGVKSFKRKYPKMARRAVEREERIFLKEKGVVSETMFDLGVTVLRSEEVLDAMAQDFPDKFEELRLAMVDKRQKKLQERRLAIALPARSAPGVESKPSQRITDPRLRLIHETAEWNARFNRDRRDERPCSFDLSNFNVVFPANKLLTLKPELTKKGSYPVALMPLQYTDYYRTYSSDELKYLPVNTVLYGPTNPYADIEFFDDDEEEIADESSSDESEESASDSEGEGSDVQCKHCNGTVKANSQDAPENLVLCSGCKAACHPSCCGLNPISAAAIKMYEWSCKDCKRCSKCDERELEGTEMISCSYCDRGAHWKCVELEKIPDGPWHCDDCDKCVSCGSTTPGSEDDAEWACENLKGNGNECSAMLCVSCAPLFKEKKFCPRCFKCYEKPEGDMAKCAACSTWVHFGCSKVSDETKQAFKEYLEEVDRSGEEAAEVPEFSCDFCSLNE